MKVIFPGSFDPITNGHVDLIKRASKLFNEVIVVISNNTNKKSLFTPEEKFALVKKVLRPLENVSVELINSDLTVNVVKYFEADAIIRGIRNVNDFSYEQEIALMNQKIEDSIETIILFSNPTTSFISSTIIREIAHFDINRLDNVVPKSVIEALRKKAYK